ncbi:hypothetical protein AVHY2522_15420 [Acidovorax sp. SUPP2522]|nr:hypothetical protein AVHY2522_15420 [Acidovorax sp. SUPP2522]
MAVISSMEAAVSSSALGLGLGAGRQVHVALGDLGAGGGHALGAAAHLRHHGLEARAHLLLRGDEPAHLVAAVGGVLAAQVARGHGAGQVHGLRQRPGDGAHEDRRQPAREGQRQRHGQRGDTQGTLVAGHALLQRGLQAGHGGGVQGAQRLDGCREVVEVVLGGQGDLGGLEQPPVGQAARCGHALAHGRHLGAQRLLQAGIAGHGAVEIAEGAFLQLAHALLQRLQRALALGRQAGAREVPGALAAQQADFFAQQRGVDQRGLDQVLRGGVGIGLEAVGVQQLLAHPQQVGHQLRVLRQGLRGGQRAGRHGLLQRAPGLRRVGPGLDLRRGGRGSRHLPVGLGQGLVHRIAHGGPARAQHLVPVEHGGRQAPVHLQPLRGLVDRDDGRRARALVARIADLLQRAAHVQPGGQRGHQHGDHAEDQEFLKQGEAVEDGHFV